MDGEYQAFLSLIQLLRMKADDCEGILAVIKSGY